MGKLTEKAAWYINRLRAMSPREVIWRLQQKRLQMKERQRFGERQRVDRHRFYLEDGGDPDILGNPHTKGLFSLDSIAPADATETHREIRLLGPYRYADYRTRWRAGFQTGRDWPLEWSYSLDYKQNDAIGDARTNWELNRHFQFAILARDYWLTRDRYLLKELEQLFESWNDANPFLWGISWTSPMEAAIRCVQWMLTQTYLQMAGVDSPMILGLAKGALNMAGHIDRHHSRFSSANNHLIVEMAALTMAGLTYGAEKWVDKGTATITAELRRQNSRDGVNLESSLHYHCFVMEACLLTALALRRAGRKVPEEWKTTLRRMAEFTAHSLTRGGCPIEFGDADGGKILDLEGGEWNYYAYVLQLASLETGVRYTDLSEEALSLTAGALYTSEEIKAASLAPAYDASRSRTFREGGYTFLRSADGEAVVAIDHAPLGFGTIAAHAHEDAMSFQLFDGDSPVLTDSGTYLYHTALPERDRMRSQSAHNTLRYPAHPHSEMRGAFLWGRKGRMTRTVSYLDLPDGIQTVDMEGRTYDGTPLRRSVSFDTIGKTLRVTDTVISPDSEITLILPPGIEVKADGNTVRAGGWTIETGELSPRLEKVTVAPRYGETASATAIRLRPTHAGNFTVTISKAHPAQQ